MRLDIVNAFLALFTFSRRLEIIPCTNVNVNEQQTADQSRSDFHEVFTMSLCTLGLKELLISLLFQIIRLRYWV